MLDRACVPCRLRGNSSSLSKDNGVTMGCSLLTEEGFLRANSSKPVAMTVMRTSSLMDSSMTAPKIIFASESTLLVIILAASSTSYIPKSLPPVMLNSTPLAPSIETSNKGDSIAALAASIARFSPLPRPIPIKAEPASAIMLLTSAKSTLISPGVVTRSATPCTP